MIIAGGLSPEPHQHEQYATNAKTQINGKAVRCCLAKHNATLNAKYSVSAHIISNFSVTKFEEKMSQNQVWWQEKEINRCISTEGETSSQLLFKARPHLPGFFNHQASEDRGPYKCSARSFWQQYHERVTINLLIWASFHAWTSWALESIEHVLLQLMLIMKEKGSKMIPVRVPHHLGPKLRHNLAMPGVY